MSPEEIAAAKRELAALYPQSVIVKIGNLEWTIVPMAMDRIARFLEQTLDLMPKVFDVGMRLQGDEAVIATVPLFLHFSGTHRVEFFKALSVAIDKPAELLEMLPPGIMPGLLTTVYKVNETFFGQSLVKYESENRATTSNGAGAKVGPTHSTSSLPTGTATQ